MLFRSRLSCSYHAISNLIGISKHACNTVNKVGYREHHLATSCGYWSWTYNFRILPTSFYRGTRLRWRLFYITFFLIVCVIVWGNHGFVTIYPTASSPRCEVHTGCWSAVGRRSFLSFWVIHVQCSFSFTTCSQVFPPSIFYNVVYRMLKQRERSGSIYHVIVEEGRWRRGIGRRGRWRWRKGSGRMESEHIVQGREKCLMLVVGCWAIAVRGEEVGHFHRVLCMRHAVGGLCSTVDTSNYR